MNVIEIRDGLLEEWETTVNELIDEVDWAIAEEDFDAIADLKSKLEGLQNSIWQEKIKPKKQEK